MVSCLGDIHIWSVKNQAHITDGDIGCFTYHDKHESVSAEHPYIEEKAAYTEGRNVTWTPRNKRPDKLRETLHDLEDLLASNRCIRSKWLSRRLLQLILSNGVVATLLVSIHTGDVDKIFIDKSLGGKLSSENPCDAILTESYMAVVYSDKSKMDYFYFVKKAGDKKIEKISTFEPRLLQVDLPGPVGRRLERRLVCNLHQDVIVCWWPTASGEALPWSPMASDKERANLVMLTAIGPKFDILTYTKTDCDPINVVFSMLQPHQMLTVEQWSGPGSEMNINSSVYEYNRNRVHKVSVATVSVKSCVVCCDRNLNEDKMLLGCSDGSLMLYDEYKKVTSLTTASVTPHMIRWHPSGTLVAVASSRGEIQLFDLSLSLLKYQLVSENPLPQKSLQVAKYLRSPSAIGYLQWSPLVDQPENKMAECNDSLFLVFERGPIVMLLVYLGVLSNGILSPLSLVTQYIKYRQIDQAIGVLSGLNWNMEGQTCYACLSAIINHLLREPLTAEREAHLESVLGTFYAPVRPLSEATVLEYRDPISRLARRFFHHLLRFSRFEKAFLLAVDIGARDLFMDIHYIASDRGESTLAEAAKRKAEEIDAESLANESFDEESYSEESEGSFTDSEEDYDHNVPPPRPPKRYQMSGNLSKATPPSLAPRSPVYQNPPVDARLAPRQQNQQEFQYTAAPLSQPWRKEYVNMSEQVVSQLESEMAADLVDEYTEALVDEPILPPPPSHADPPGGNQQQTDGSSSKVKVIHFGIV